MNRRKIVHIFLHVLTPCFKRTSADGGSVYTYIVPRCVGVTYFRIVLLGLVFAVPRFQRLPSLVHDHWAVFHDRLWTWSGWTVFRRGGLRVFWFY